VWPRSARVLRGKYREMCGVGEEGGNRRACARLSSRAVVVITQHEEEAGCQSSRKAEARPRTRTAENPRRTPSPGRGPRGWCGERAGARAALLCSL
jgi:hypothetical protein